MTKPISHIVAYVRFLPELNERLKRMEKALGLTKCAVMRLAIERGLPVLEEQFTPKPQPTQTQP